MLASITEGPESRWCWSDALIVRQQWCHYPLQENDQVLSEMFFSIPLACEVTMLKKKLKKGSDKNKKHI